MFSGETAPTYTVAKTHAETIVDAEMLAKQIASPVTAQYIEKHIKIYRAIGKGNVPKLLFPTTTIEGEFTSGEALTDVINRQGPVLEQ